MVALSAAVASLPSLIAVRNDGGVSRFNPRAGESIDPTAADKATIDAQIKNKQIKVYVYNSQNATPDVQAQVDAAKKAGIPVSTITETMTRAGASFQDWHVAQLTALKQALGQATGK